MLQSDDDRWPDWDDELEELESWEFDKVLERERPVKKEIIDQETSVKREASDECITNKSKKTGKKKQDVTPKPSTAELVRYASLGTELLAGVLVGTFLGWLFNRFTGYTGPWALVVGVIIGSIAGFLNIYRAVVEEEERGEHNKSGSSK